ncbi:MAG: thiamine phosphate synthase [Bacteroidota bacterium]
MKISLVSSFYDIPNEVHLLNLLFCNGLEVFHLRKDLDCKHLGGTEKYTEKRIRNYIESIPIYFRDRIIMHSHFNLVEEYGLLGAHFTKKYTHQEYLKDEGLSKKHFKKIGFSLHSIAEITEYADTYDYLFLSPIFDSISNKGYNSKFNLTRLKSFLETTSVQSEIMALGGMNHTKVEKVNELGFNGLSLLGHIWSRFDEDQDIIGALNRYLHIMALKNGFLEKQTETKA